MGTTPILGLPYPDDTDPVAQGAADMQALAEAVEGALGDLTTWQPWNPAYSADTAMTIANVTGSHPSGDKCRYRVEGKTCYVSHARILNKGGTLGSSILLTPPPGIVPAYGRAQFTAEADNSTGRAGFFDSFTEIAVRKWPDWSTGSQTFVAGAHWIVFDGFFEIV